MKYKIITYSKVSYVAIALVIASICALLFMAFQDHYFWFDESGQFFMAKGLNHYSEPYSSPGSLTDVIENNRGYNLDPGGFTILLHWWSFISNNDVFLKILPLLFFFSCSFFIYKICRKEELCPSYSLFIALLIFIIPQFFGMSYFLRAYSMEMCGVAIGVYLLYLLREKESIPFIVLISLALSVFCTSRYGFILAAFAISLRVLYRFYNTNRWSSQLVKAVIYGLPLLITVGMVFFGMMRYQSPDVRNIGYAQYILGNPIILIKNPLSLLFYYVAGLFVYKKIKKQEVSEIHIDSIIIASVFFLFSVIGKYPWDLIRTMSATFILMYAAVIETFKLIKFNERYFCLLTVASLLFIGVCHTRNMYLDHANSSEMVNELVDYLKGNNDGSKIFIELHYNPDLRYQYEFGSLKGRAKEDKYPTHFSFQKNQSQVKGSKRINKEIVNDEYKYVLAGDNVDGAMLYPEKYMRYGSYKYFYIRK